MVTFEILVGPYAVAHLRLSQRVLVEGGKLPADGAHVYLTDTLEPPHATPPGHLPLAYKALGEEHRRAQKVKADTAVLVCLGNPPYDRQTIAPDDAAGTARKGGWIRYGDAHRDGAGRLQDFIAPLNPLGLGLHAKNLYNDYVYFWRCALWKVFEIGKGLFAPVRREVWSFSISGFEVVKSWLAYRMRDCSGKKSSSLDDIRPERWEFDGELLELLLVLDHTIDLQPALATALQAVLAGGLFAAAELPQPDETQRRTGVEVRSGLLPLCA